MKYSWLHVLGVGWNRSNKSLSQGNMVWSVCGPPFGLWFKSSNIYRGWVNRYESQEESHS